MSAALVVTRQSFPDVYVDAIDKLRQGATYDAIDKLICESITALGIPLDNLELLPYGIPLPSYGAQLDECEFYAAYPDVIPVMALFGVTSQSDNYTVEVAARVTRAGAILIDSLEAQGNESNESLLWLLKWLFSSTGNSCVDYDYESMQYIQPLSWEEDDIAFAREMIEEAEGIMAEVLAGLYWLTSQPAVMQALQDNIQSIYSALHKSNGKEEKLKVKLNWQSLHGYLP